MSNTGTHSHPFQTNLRNSGADIMRDQQIMQRGPEVEAEGRDASPKVREERSDWPFPTPTGRCTGPAPYTQAKGNTLASNLGTQRHGV